MAPVTEVCREVVSRLLVRAAGCIWGGACWGSVSSMPPTYQLGVRKPGHSLSPVCVEGRRCLLSLSGIPWEEVKPLLGPQAPTTHLEDPDGVPGLSRPQLLWTFPERNNREKIFHSLFQKKKKNENQSLKLEL